MKVGFVGWRGMVGSVLMQRMNEENDFPNLTSSTSDPSVIINNSYDKTLQPEKNPGVLDETFITCDTPSWDLMNSLVCLSLELLYFLPSSQQKAQTCIWLFNQNRLISCFATLFALVFDASLNKLLLEIMHNLVVLVVKK